MAPSDQGEGGLRLDFGIYQGIFYRLEAWVLENRNDVIVSIVFLFFLSV